MEKEYNPLLKEIQEIKMTADEKSVVLNNLVSFMDANPVKAKVSTVRHTTFLKPAPSPFFSRFSFSPALRMVALVLVIAVIAGSGVSYAAASALPGDILYPAKINFNEAIASVFKITPEAKAAYAETRVEARLAEAQTLINEGKFTDARKDEAEAQIDSHMQIALARIKTLPEEKRTALARQANEVLLPRIADHKALVRAIVIQQKNPRITNETTASSTINIGVVATPHTLSESAEPSGTTNTTISNTIDTVDRLESEAMRTLNEAENAVNSLRAIRLIRPEAQTRLATRINTIQLVVDTANQAFVQRQYQTTIDNAQKAIQMVNETRNAIDTFNNNMEPQMVGTEVPSTTIQSAIQ